MTFAEASELAYFGAKILHPISMQPAAAFNIPVRIKNSYNPTHPGTVIKAVVDDRDQDHLVTAITTKSHQTVIDITSTRMLGQHGFLAQVGTKRRDFPRGAAAFSVSAQYHGRSFRINNSFSICQPLRRSSASSSNIASAWTW